MPVWSDYYSGYFSYIDCLTMRHGARLRAAIECLHILAQGHRPIKDVLREWGHGNRFAGSKDRAVIGNYVYDVLRRRLSLGKIMNDDDPRVLVLAVDYLSWGTPLVDLMDFGDDAHAPKPLSAQETALLEAYSLQDQTVLEDNKNAHEWADVPEWLWPHFKAAFGDEAVAQGKAMAERAPLDLRVNRLKKRREAVLKKLAHWKAEPCALSPDGIRLRMRDKAGRSPAVHSHEGYAKGWFEIQDEGSQLSALLVADLLQQSLEQKGKKSFQIFDLCAGAGGKSLALASLFDNKGQIFAYDRDPHRLKNIWPRLSRAGARNVQVIGADELAKRDGLQDKMDCVLIDAPCSGTGTWRRHPDSKWRLNPQSLVQRQKEQSALLDEASHYLRDDGLMVYVTCSVLRDENEQRIADFIKQHENFQIVDLNDAESRPDWLSDLMVTGEGFLRLSPLTSQSDGFFVAVLRRKA
jgi:16S rRNA (cytosine967-C5)-methyltransferase